MIDLTKPVQTRDGRKVRILCTDRVPTPGGPTIIALVTLESGVESVYYFMPDGSMYGGEGSVLINVPERKEKFFNVYDFGMGDKYDSLAKAKGQQAKSALAVCKMTLEDGLPVSVEVVEKYDAS